MQPGDILQLPMIEVPLEASPAGRRFHVLRGPRAEAIASIVPVRLSPKVTEPAYALTSGETILVTERALSDLPGGVQGVLLRSSKDSRLLTWRRHALVDEFRSEWQADPDSTLREIRSTWLASVRIPAAQLTHPPGTAQLRPPQLGALCAIGAHWSLHSTPATIVMPTGTGKTETMIAAVAGFLDGPCLVVVPTVALRDQTAAKFRELGLLRALGAISPDARNPVVGILEHRPKSSADIEFLRRCHVAIAVVNTVSQGTALEHLADIAKFHNCLVLDEAHHVPARTWSALRDAFRDVRTLQFTATPFRRDGEPVDGKIIYNYPLHRAQTEGYFRPIHFHAVTDHDPQTADGNIAKRAVAQLRGDIKLGFDHVLMARCASIERAQAVAPIYQNLAPDFSPVIIHSKDPGSAAAVAQLKSGGTRIVVCVDMLGEGFDLPQLKIAALHDAHKSLGVLLQFTGRFTRSSAPTAIGDASVFANIADMSVSNELEHLYDEDADWNKLLPELSFDAVEEQQRLQEFLADTTRLDDAEFDEQTTSFTAKNLKPTLSTLIYTCSDFHPEAFIASLRDDEEIRGVWVNKKRRVLAYIRRTAPEVEWSNVRSLTDSRWDLVLAVHDEALKLLFIASSDKSTSYSALAGAVGGSDVTQVTGDNIFRCFGGISRLQFQNIGLRRHARRNLSFSLYSGADVGTALSSAQKTTATKSNMFGVGFEGGRPVSIGCSKKGRVWCREQGRIPEFMRWAHDVGVKLRDDRISTDDVLDHVMIPKEIEAFPAKEVLCLDWPIEIRDKLEERVRLVSGAGIEFPLSDVTIEHVPAAGTGTLCFRVLTATAAGEYAITFGGATGVTVRNTAGEPWRLTIGRRNEDLAAQLSEWPPDVLYVDGSELSGNSLVEPRGRTVEPLPTSNVVAWDWSGVALQKESLWKGGVRHDDSIQARALRELLKRRFDVIVDDDGPGEAADLVCIAERSNHIELVLAHCKYSGGDEGGRRVKDVMEVCAQAVRSSRWVWKFEELIEHLLRRAASRGISAPRILHGDAPELRKMRRAHRKKPIRVEVLVVQPGYSGGAPSEGQALVLSAAHSYLLETVQVGLHVACGA